MLRLEENTAGSFADVARLARISLPVAQTEAWDRFEQVSGNEPWLRFVVLNEAGVRAFISLTKFTVRSVPYVWVKEGPAWVGDKPAEEEELEILSILSDEIRNRDSRIVFVRMHTWSEPEGARPLLQFLPYDLTVVVDLEPSEEAIFANMRQGGRRNIRKGERNGVQVEDWTGLGEQRFQQLYDILLETASRDDFGVHPPEIYMHMMRALGPEHSRMFVATHEGKPVAWALITINDANATYYYGASSRAAHSVYAADLLHWEIMKILKSEGVRSYDFMGISSEIAPSLSGVTQFKRKFSKQVTQVAPARDFPVRPLVYEGLVKAQAGLQWLRELRQGPKSENP